MKHASPATLHQIDDLLNLLNGFPGLTEKKRGIYFHGNAAFLHFHEDSGGVCADLRTGDDWKRYPVNEESDRLRLVIRIRQALPGAPGGASPSAPDASHGLKFARIAAH